MSKQEREAYIRKLLADGKTPEEVVTIVVEKTGVKANTVEKQMREIVAADGEAPATDTDGPTDGEKEPEAPEETTDEEEPETTDEEPEAPEETTDEEEPETTDEEPEAPEPPAKKPKGSKTYKGLLTKEDKANPNRSKGRVDEYTVLEEDKDFYHVEVEATSFNPNTGQKTSTPAIKKLDGPAFVKVKASAKRLGYIHFKVIHSPS
jgi:hypothetical protein